MEELKKLIQEEKPLLNQVHGDIVELRDLFIPFLAKMESFMEHMRAYVDKENSK